MERRMEWAWCTCYHRSDIRLFGFLIRAKQVFGNPSFHSPFKESFPSILPSSTFETMFMKLLLIILTIIMNVIAKTFRQKWGWASSILISSVHFVFLQKTAVI